MAEVDMNPDTRLKMEKARKLLRAYLDESVPDLAGRDAWKADPKKYESGRAILESDPNIQKFVLAIAFEQMTGQQDIPESPDLDNVSWAKSLGFENPRRIEESVERIGVWFKNYNDESIEQFVAQTIRDNEEWASNPENVQKFRESLERPRFSGFDSPYYRSYTAVARRCVQTTLSLVRYELVSLLLRRKRLLQESEICSLLDFVCSAVPRMPTMRPSMNLPLREILSAVENFKKAVGLSDNLQQRLEKLRTILRENENPYAFGVDAVPRVEAIIGPSLDLELEKGDAWADLAMQDLEAMKPEVRKAWNNLLHHAITARSSKPSKKWAKRASELIEPIGQTEFSNQVSEWFPAVGERGSHELTAFHRQYSIDINQVITQYNADVLKGIVWCCWGMDDPKICRSVSDLAETCFQNVRYIGPRCKGVGFACLAALGSMPGEDPVAHLTRLKLRIKDGSARKQAEKILNAVAKERGISAEDLEDAAVPTLGMEEPGLLKQTLGNYTALLRITGIHSTELVWLKPDGKMQKSVPSEIKQDFPKEFKELQEKNKEIKKMLPPQRDRLEGAYLRRRQWNFKSWCDYCLDHPLVATLARRLIWRFQKGDRDALGSWLDGRLVDIDDIPLDWLDKNTTVRLWHPIGCDIDKTLQWRDWLERHEIQQPFKQAHREVYILTDAERETRIYSNRFASHILRQHQFRKLCRQRNWRHKLMGIWESSDVPSLSLPHWELSAEFWVGGVGTADLDETHFTLSGAFLSITTDQVRFVDASGEPVPLTEVSPLVFSEVMRNVDLFVSVCSIGNDPNWQEGGVVGDYWQRYSFGDLSESSTMRKQVLERLLPRLKIADKCSITGKYLVVRGELRTYKIHLRSGNVLMEPNDQYLCVVRGRGGAFKTKDKGKLFLPFEGDEMLSLILSKAFMLADDKNIKDQTILNQIRRR
jgi:hypothetical protein